MRTTLASAFAELARDLRSKSPPDLNTERAWRDGNLQYKYWPVQVRMAAVLNSSISSAGSLKKVLNCSRRLRKTTTALVEAIEKVGLKKRNALIRFAAPTRDMIVTIIIPIMDLICEDAPDDLKPVWQQSRHCYFFPSTGARLYVAGCDNLRFINRLRGKAADLCIVDEAQDIVHLRYLVDDVLMPQLLGVDKARGPLWILFTPPKTPIHDVRRYAMEAKAANDGSYAEFTIFEGEYAQGVIDQFCKEAGGAESTTWLREYMCKFVVDKNFAIVPEWEDSMVQEYVPDEFYRFYALYEGLDISGGSKHATANIYAVYDFLKAKLFVQGETKISAAETTTERLAADVKAKETELWKERKPLLRIADNSNLILLRDLGTLHALHYAPTSKDTLDAMVNELRLWVNAGRIVVSPNCEQLIGCLKYGVWNNKRTEWEESLAYGHFDALAALMYLVRYVDQKTNPIPKDYGMNKAEMFVSPKITQDQGVNAAALKKAFGIKAGRKR